jgi:N-acetylneuraminic acid mutarotase
MSTSFVKRCVVALASVVMAWASTSVASGFSNAAPLATARSEHTATLLPSGKVLVAAGQDSGHFMLASAELYDPANDSWSAAGSMTVARQQHSATLLPSGKVLVVGGLNQAVFITSAELYDPSTGRWNAAGSLAAARASHTATLLPSGKVLVAGGYDAAGALASAQLYDPLSNSWSVAASMANARHNHTATLLPSGKVLVAGGYQAGFNEGAFVTSVELYDPASNSWSAAASMTVSRAQHKSTLLPSGEVLVASGFTVAGNTTSAELYNPATDSWSNAGSLAAARVAHTATLLPSGQVLVVGGIGNGDDVLGSVELYDPTSNSWSSTGSLAAARYIHTATLLPSGQVLVAGGLGLGFSALASAELYGQAPAPVPIGPGFTGAWFDPAQSGHGLFIEILPNSRLLAGWFAFNPAGTQQAWFVGAGTYSGNMATITAVSLPTGGRWIPNFDPSQIVNNLWGTLTFSFTDCNHGRVDFSSVLGYGTGSMTLTRLTQPVGLSCP